jgi:hypothetical protein
MAPAEWYYAKDNQQQGPVASADLKRLSLAGQLGPEDLVWREGLTDWIPARKVKGLFDPGTKTPSEAIAPESFTPEPPAPAPESREPDFAQPFPTDPVPESPAVAVEPVLHAVPERPSRHPLDMLLDALRQVFTASFVESTVRLFALCGQYGLYAGMLLVLSTAIVLGWKTKSATEVAAGITIVLILAVLQYGAPRLLAALTRLDQGSSGRVNTTVVPDCFALLFLVLGVTLLVTMTIWSIQSKDYWGVLPAVASFILCEFVALVALNHAALGVTATPSVRAGEESIGVLTFLLKTGLKVTPVGFGAGIMATSIGLAGSLCVIAFQDDSPTSSGQILSLSGLEDLQLPGLTSSGFGDLQLFSGPEIVTKTFPLVLCAAIPLIAYSVFLMYYLMVDVIRAVLAGRGTGAVGADERPDET